jgi:hypothetical protein
MDEADRATSWKSAKPWYGSNAKVSHVMGMMTYLEVRDVHFAGRHQPSNLPFKSRHLTVELAEYQLHDFQDAGTSIEEDRLGVCENVRERAEENVRTCENVREKRYVKSRWSRDT